MKKRARFRGALLGLACGDAVGATVEFQARGTFAPVTDMVGGGLFKLQPGQWTDDTAMALCLATSLVEKKGFDARDQMDRYVAWLTIGYHSSTGECFDIGNTTLAALRRYQVYGNPYSGSPDPKTAGNGSIMRLAPAPMFFFPDLVVAISRAGESSLTTHGAPECIDACRLLGAMLIKALAGKSKEEILTPPHFPKETGIILSPRLQALAEGVYRCKRDTMLAGSGYVVKSLEAALWCFDHTENFRTAVLRAANLGDDADTTAAVCGQLAGAYYGEDGIPPEWLARLARRAEITRLADRLGSSPKSKVQSLKSEVLNP